MLPVLYVVICPQSALPVEVFQFGDFNIAILMTVESECSEPSYERGKCFLILVAAKNYFGPGSISTLFLLGFSLSLHTISVLSPFCSYPIICTVSALALSRFYFSPCSDLRLPLFCFLSDDDLLFSPVPIPSRFYCGLTSIRVLILSQSWRDSFALGTTLSICILIISRLFWNYKVSL